MTPRIIRQIAGLRDTVRAWRMAGQSIGLVPTMGALHAGHLSLVEAARRDCDRVIVTIFVNRRQFDNPEDLARYPRTEAADAARLAPLGPDLVFAPDEAEVYPPGHDTRVRVAGLSEVLEGAHRSGHFDGMATVVAMLFNMAQPDRAFFGEKDWQQLQIVRQMVRDLKLPIEIVPCPSIRAPDGLALSSRNRQLADAARARAAALPAMLFAAGKAIEAGTPPAQALMDGRQALTGAGFDPVDYLALCDAETLGPPAAGRPARLLVAAWLDGVRLIDNLAVTLP